MSCDALASALRTNPFHLVDLKLGNNPDLGDSGVSHLCELLQSPDCRLERLELNNCGLSDYSCSSLASALRSNPHPRLKALELGENRDLGDSGLIRLCTFLQSPLCLLETLSLWSCSLTESSCLSLASALNANPSRLKELDLNDNPDLKDSGLELLSSFLQSADCRLEKLGLRCCGLSESGCSSLTFALQSGLSRLKALDLRKKDSGTSDVENLRRRLDLLELWCCNLTEMSCDALASALRTNPFHLVDLKLGNNPDLGDSGVSHLCELLQSPDCRLERLELKNCGLSDYSCSSLASALRSNPHPRLKALELGENRDLGDSGLIRLCTFLQSPLCLLETLSLWSCSLTESSCLSLASALNANPSRLKELDLNDNPDLKDSGLELLSSFLQSADCRLEKLGLRCCGLSESGCSSLTFALQSGLSPLKALDLRKNDSGTSDVENLRRRLDLLEL